MVIYLAVVVLKAFQINFEEIWKLKPSIKCQTSEVYQELIIFSMKMSPPWNFFQQLFLKLFFSQIIEVYIFGKNN